ncbi:MAG: Ig-like domain-containing protein [Polyangiales bacterium]|nr:Ig-like domain-containing protein [Myxococcales bacterium]MCB9661601.1 Ig-like domain-containing protein [Sandaracinaceae bacterium]
MLTVVVMIVGCGAGGEQPPVGLPDASVPVDTEAPVIVSISPPDGALGIGEDAVVVITFSEPMDRLSVQDSVAAADLGAVDYTWSSDNTRLTITPVNPLSYATGSDPGVVSALPFTVIVGTGGQDVAGNTVQAGAQSTFTTYRAIAASLLSVEALTATTDPTAVASTVGALYIGDDGNGGTAKGTRGFITMTLAGIPDEAVGIASATLETASVGTNGAPFLELGTLLLDHARFTIATDAFAAATEAEVNAAFNLVPLTTVGSWMTDENTVPSMDVTDAVRTDFAERATLGDRSQYRVRMATDLNTDANADGVLLSRDDLVLRVAYLLP